MTKLRKDGSKPPRKAVLRSFEEAIDLALDGWGMAPGLRSLAERSLACVSKHPTDSEVLELDAGLTSLVERLTQVQTVVGGKAQQVKKGRPSGSGRKRPAPESIWSMAAARLGVYKPMGRPPITPITTDKLLMMVGRLEEAGDAPNTLAACKLIVKERRIAAGRRTPDAEVAKEAATLARRIYDKRSRSRKLIRDISRS